MSELLTEPSAVGDADVWWQSHQKVSRPPPLKQARNLAGSAHGQGRF